MLIHRTPRIILPAESVALSEAAFEMDVESGLLYISLLEPGVALAKEDLYVPGLMGKVKDLCEVLQDGKYIRTEDSIQYLPINLDELDYFDARPLFESLIKGYICLFFTYFSDEKTFATLLKMMGVFKGTVDWIKFVSYSNAALDGKFQAKPDCTLTGSLPDRLEEFYTFKTPEGETAFSLTDKGFDFGKGPEPSRSLRNCWIMCRNLVEEFSKYCDLGTNRGRTPCFTMNLKGLEVPESIWLTRGIQEELWYPYIRSRAHLEEVTSFESPYMSEEEIYNSRVGFGDEYQE